MSFLAKMFVHDRVINVLHTNIHLYQQCDPTTQQPNAKTNGGLFQVVIEADEHTDLLHTVISGTMCNGYIRFFKRDGMSKLMDYEFFDAYIIEISTHFNANSPDPMTDTLTFSPGILRFGDVVHEKWWKVTDLNREKIAESTDNSPSISSVNWLNENGENIKEAGYDSDTSLMVEVMNPDGGSVEIVIEKEDGTEFEEGKTAINFTEHIDDDGVVELKAFKIKKEWEDFKTAHIDKLVAKVKHNGSHKKSTIQITPRPKATLHFRPHSGWAGEYGFDWMRIKDTTIDGDIDYEQNVGKYGTIPATKRGAVFTVNNYAALEKEYNPINMNGKKDAAGNPIQYYVPWLNIYREPNITNNPYAEMELEVEIEVEPDELYIEFNATYFDIATATVSPKDSNLKQFKLDKGMLAKTTAGSPNKTDIKLECIHTLPKDETINVWAVKNKLDGTPGTPILSGLLTVKANNKVNRRIANIVFVNVITDINGNGGGVDGITQANATLQEAYLSPFLKQALVNPKIENKTLNLSNPTTTEVQTLNNDYTLIKGTKKIFNKYHNTGGDDLTTFLEKQFDSEPTNIQYKKYYKVFFLGDAGGRKDGVNIVRLGGHANDIPSKECVMYANPKPFYVAHELMHCMGLHHSFDNDGTFTFKIGQTENIMDYSHIAAYATPNGTLTQISTWKWQWEVLKNNNTKEP